MLGLIFKKRNYTKKKVPKGNERKVVEKTFEECLIDLRAATNKALTKTKVLNLLQNLEKYLPTNQMLMQSASGFHPINIA